MPAPRRHVGVIYGNVGSTEFELAVSDPSLRRLDYVEVEQEGQRILCQVGDVERRSSLSFDQALAVAHDRGEDGPDGLSATVHVIGFVDGRGRVQTPRNPFRAGMPVQAAADVLVTAVLGLEGAAETSAYLGHVKGSRIPVRLSLNVLAQKHVSVLAKTGAGKSYTVGVVLEEFLKAKVPLVILDPHGEYGSLRNANVEEQELEAMVRFGIRPRSFQKQIREFALDTFLNPDAEKLRLEGLNLEGHEVADLLGGKLSSGQMGVLYQAVKEVKEVNPAYTLRDVMEFVGQNKSSAKWNVLNALEALDSTGVFDTRGTPVKELVRPGQCTIINLKGVAPDVQEIVVTRLSNLLWQTRKRNEVAPHILVVEEAHNFCPERGIGNAVSGPVLRTIASEGRKFGMGLVIVSQRPAKIDKNVLSQCNTQIVLKVTNPNDLKAIVQSLEGITGASADEVQRLPVGVALVAGGGLTQPVYVDVRPRHTRHGGRSVEIVKEDGQDGAKASGEKDGGPAPDVHPAFTAPPEPARRRPPPRSEARPAADPAATAEGGAGHAEPVPAEPPVTGPAAPPGPLEAAHGTPPALRSWSKADKQHIHRVAARIGIVGQDQDPERTLSLLQRLPAQNGRTTEERIVLYHEIAHEVCFVEDPACIRCPMQEACQHHAKAKQERRKTRSPIRRLWRR